MYIYTNYEDCPNYITSGKLYKAVPVGNNNVKSIMNGFTFTDDYNTRCYTIEVASSHLGDIGQWHVLSDYHGLD